MAQALPVGGYGTLRVVPPAVLESAIKKQDRDRATANAAPQPVLSSLAGFIRSQYEIFRNHRNNTSSGWSERLLIALRAFNGQYDANKLAEIRKFGGSEVYARIVAMKCRGASSLLRDVYLSADRPWGIDPPTDPKIPQEIIDSVQQLVEAELNTLHQSGQPPDVGAIRDRTFDLMEAAREAAKKKAVKQSHVAEDKIDELLREGGFYKALAEFIVDVPLFPFACIKGPEVRIVPQVTWEGNGGRPLIQQKPKLFWKRVSPFDLYWTPGVSDIEDAAVLERVRYTRSDLNDLLDLPGYNVEAIRRVLDMYGRGGLADNWDYTDAERAVQENRENPQINRSGLISGMEYHGNVQGRMLLDYGMDESQVPDPMRDYMVQTWLIGPEVIKVQMSPSPRKRHPYFITSFEKVPGTPVGNGLPDIISDIQEVCNATMRNLVNNLAIASGPQVVVDVTKLAPDEDGEELYPWKRWHVQSDPLGGNNGQGPVSFFMPTSNAQELMAVYQQFSGLADDLSGIPKYLSGQAPGGAGRTASGLAMLMGNAGKLLQTVAANIDRDVMDPALSGLFDLLMLTDTSGLLTGEEQIQIKGVNVAVQKETERSRALEFLQVTANPMDAQIVGMKGRAAVLRTVADKIGIPGEDIVPSEEELDAQQKAQQQMQAHMAQAGAQAQGGQQGPSATQDMGPRTNTASTIAGGVG